MKRIVFIDIAKAICIILVVIGHFVPDNSPEWYVALHDIIYTFHMPLFMFASGYIYIATKKDSPYWAFLLKKAKRLMLPYFATSVIVITIKLLTQGSMSVDNPVTWRSYIRMFYLPEAGYFLWFIWALWWMFVIVPLFKTKVSRLIFFAISLILHYIPLSLPEVFCLEQFKNMLVFFMLGVVVYEIKDINKFVSGYKPVQVIVTTIMFVVLQYAAKSIGGGKIVTAVNLILPYVGIWFVLEVSKFLNHSLRNIQSSWLMAVSAASYIIYLFHTTFEGFAKAVFRKLPLDSDLWYVFVPEAAVVVALGVVAPIILYKLFKKYRTTRFLFGL